MMKILGISLVAMGLAAALPACTGPIQANQDPNMPSQVTVDSYWLQAEVYATVLPPTRVGAGQLQVPIELRNKTDHDLSLDYQGTFVDKNGMQVDNAPSWIHVMVPQRGTAQVTLTSLSANAADFRVHIREAK